MKNRMKDLFAEIEAKHIVCECKNPECVYKKNFLKLKEKYLGVKQSEAKRAD